MEKQLVDVVAYALGVLAWLFDLQKRHPLQDHVLLGPPRNLLYTHRPCCYLVVEPP